MSENQGSHLSVDRPQSFQIKGALLPMSVLELRSKDLLKLKTELKAKVEAAPEFFQQSPVVFSFEFLDDALGFDLQELYNFCLSLGLLPTGVKGADEGLQISARSLGLANFAKGKTRADAELPEENSELPNNASYGARVSQFTDSATVKMPGAEVEEVPAVDYSEPQGEIVQVDTKVITSPVRSGQQIYSPGDMVILASVSAGAEVLAAGNIHVYGALRGRALAGVRGDESARVFCQSQEAELISVAGEFMIDENLRSANWREPAQAFVRDGVLVVEKLEV